jgi:hypothetical protein
MDGMGHSRLRILDRLRAMLTRRRDRHLLELRRAARRELTSLLNRGLVERVLLVPPEFGGPDEPWNVTYLPPAAAARKRRFDARVVGRAARGGVRRRRRVRAGAAPAQRGRRPAGARGDRRSPPRVTAQRRYGRGMPYPGGGTGSAPARVSASNTPAASPPITWVNTAPIRKWSCSRALAHGVRGNPHVPADPHLQEELLARPHRRACPQPEPGHRAVAQPDAAEPRDPAAAAARDDVDVPRAPAAGVATLVEGGRRAVRSRGGHHHRLRTAARAG